MPRQLAVVLARAKQMELLKKQGHQEEVSAACPWAFYSATAVTP